MHHTCEPAHPEPTSQDTLQTSDPIFFISHIPVLNFAGTTRNRLHHTCVPTLNQRSKDTPHNLRPQDFHLTHPSFELCRSSSPYYTTHVSQPILNQRPKTLQTSDPIFFISHIPLLNFAGTALHIRRPWPSPNLLCHSPLLLRHSSLPLPGFKRFKLLQPSKSLAPPATTLTTLQLLHGFLAAAATKPPGLQPALSWPSAFHHCSLPFACT